MLFSIQEMSEGVKCRNRFGKVEIQTFKSTHTNSGK